MKLIICILVTFVSTSFYSLQFTNIDGNPVSMGQFEGKKILIVNIATNSPRVGQLADLQQLHQQHGDSIVVIGFPSNSFGNEPRSDSEIKQFCQTNYGVTFLLASKNAVAGVDLQAVFNWLGHKTENGNANAAAMGDFQKFLVNKQGRLVGVYSPATLVTGPELTHALHN